MTSVLGPSKIEPSNIESSQKIAAAKKKDASRQPLMPEAFSLPFSFETHVSLSQKGDTAKITGNTQMSLLSYCKSAVKRLLEACKGEKVEKTVDESQEESSIQTKSVSKPALESPKEVDKEALLKCICEIETILNAVKNLKEEPEEIGNVPQNKKEALLFLRSLRMMSAQKELLDDESLFRTLEMGFKQKEHKVMHEKYMKLVAKKDKIEKSKKFWNRLELGFSITTMVALGLGFGLSLLSSASAGSLAPLMKMLGPGIQTAGSAAMMLEGIGKMKSGLLEYDLGQKMGKMNDLRHQSSVHETVLDQLVSELGRTQDQMLEICKQMRQALVNTAETASKMRA